MTWTPEQRRAIEARGKNLLLTAAAGSGKTAVLVERILSLIEEGVDLDRLLVVTFTRAAASDMREKLRARLSDLADGRPEFRRQLPMLERASISTIHSLCADLIRSHFEAADADPAFRILEGPELKQLEAKALKEALGEAYAQPDEPFEALAAGRTPNQIGEMVRALYIFAMARPDPEGWMTRSAQDAEAGAGEWIEILLEAARHALEDALIYARAALAFALEPDGPDHYLEAIRSDITLLEYLCTLNYPDLQEYFNGRLEFERLKSKKGAKDDPLAQRAKAMREEMKGLVRNKAAGKLAIPYAIAQEDACASAVAIGALAALVIRFSQILDEMKAECSALSFSDLEHRSLRALSDPSVVESVRAQYESVMVDEYQDVSDVQEAILQAIARGDNTFMVGDVKQSIYRFRLAEPSLFLGKQDAYGRGEGGEAVALNRNFRSRKAVLDFCNAVFSRAMHGDWAEITYDEQARLYPGAEYEGGDPQTELHLISTQLEDREEDLGEPDDVDDALGDMKAAEIEGLLAAERIRSILGEPLYDAKKQKWRTIRPRDIVILSRASSGVLPLMGEVLLREGIPAYADATGGYFDVLEVRVALAFLKLIENRRDDLSWIAALRSPMVGLQSDALARIRAQTPDGPYCDAVERFAQGDSLDARRVLLLSDWLIEWRALSKYMQLPLLIDRVLTETGYYAYVGALPGGAQRQANLDMLIVRASAYERQDAGGLSGFLAYIGEIHRTGDDMGAAHVLGEEDDVVRLMTVHKSKGLEFPVVIGVQMGRNFRGPSPKRALCMHRRLGIGFAHIDRALHTTRDTVIRRAIAEVQHQEAMAEELRILYVLLTRAMDRLILIGSVKDPLAASERYVMQTRAPLMPGSFLDILAPAALFMPGGNDLALNDDAPLAEVGAPSILVRWHSRETLPAPAADLAVVDARSSAMDDGFLESYNWRYPHEGAELLPVKLTASGLSREVIGPDAPIELVPRPSFLHEQSMNALERGSALHTAMQGLALDRLRGLDWEMMRREIAVQLDDLLNRGLLTDAMRRSIDVESILRFWTGELGRRALDAEVLHREWTFNLRMTACEAMGLDSDEWMLVQGAIDLCFMEGGQWILVDYKSDRPDEGVLEAQYATQVGIYAEALRRITDRPVAEAHIYLLRAGTSILVRA